MVLVFVIVVTAVLLVALATLGWARWRPRVLGNEDDDPAAVEQRVQQQIYGRRTLNVQGLVAPGGVAGEALEPGERSSELAA